jgi:hypothetical protein
MAKQSAALLLTQLGLGGNTGGGGVLKLPSKAQLESVGLTDPKVLKEFAGHTFQIPMGITGSKLSASQAVQAVLDQLPEAVRNATYDYLGLNDPQLGSTTGKPSSMTQRIDAILPMIEAGNGDLGFVNYQQVLSFQAQQQGITQIQQTGGMGIEAAKIGATYSAEYSAETSVDNYLTTWGLDTPAMTQYVAEMATNPHGAMTSPSEILNVIRGGSSGLGANVDAAIHQAYNNAFPGLAEYMKQPGALKMTESQYMQYTQSIMTSATQYGAPMPTQAQIGQLLNGHVSAAEYSQRVQDVYAVIANADQNTKNILQQEYGVSNKDLMHYFMDPKNALQTMQRNVASAEIQDYAQRVGLSNLGMQAGNELGQMAKLASVKGGQALGYGISQIESSLLNASRDVALTQSLPGQNAPTVNTQTLIASQLAGYGGINQVAAQTAVARAEEAKAAPFEKGGGYAESQKGVVGLGSART